MRGPTLSRRGFLGATALLGLTACTPAVSTPVTTTAGVPVPGPIDSPVALADWIGANLEHASVLFDDGHGTAFTHLAERARPIASAVKVVHLTAYAQAVAAGRLDPNAPVTVAEWERWYIAGADGGAHPAALAALGVDPTGTVRWDDIVAAMIDFSDNAATDLLTATLGVDALTAAARGGDWTPYDPAFIAGEDLVVLSPPAETDRRLRAQALGQGFADGDPVLRELAAQYASGGATGGGGALPTTTPPTDPDAAWNAGVELWDGSWAATVTQLAGLHRAAATDALGPLESAVVRRHLERGLAGSLPPGVAGFGQKGGSLAGILSYAGYARGEDGTLGLSVISLSRLPQQVWTESTTQIVALGQQVLVDPEVRDRLGAALGA